MKSSTMIGGTGAHDRHPSDFYETPPHATYALMKQLDLKIGTWIWEPACGDGAITSILKMMGYKVVGTDIRKGVGHDFLMDLPIKSDWIITNPPFNLADEFIEEAWSIGVPFAFLLKATFANTKAHGKLFHKCPPTGVYPLTWRPAMAPDRGKSPTMDFTWFVWRHDGEPYRPLMKG